MKIHTWETPFPCQRNPRLYLFTTGHFQNQRSKPKITKIGKTIQSETTPAPRVGAHVACMVFLWPFTTPFSPWEFTPSTPNPGVTNERPSNRPSCQSSQPVIQENWAWRELWSLEICSFAWDWHNSCRITTSNLTQPSLIWMPTLILLHPNRTIHEQPSQVWPMGWDLNQFSHRKCGGITFDIKFNQKCGTGR